MVSIISLWLPIVLSAVVVFIVSSVLHMVFKYHQSDYAKLPAEAEISAALRPFNIPPGDYATPYCADMKEMATPEYVEKQQQGPNIMMTVVPNGPASMGTPLIQWFVYSLVVGVFAAYVSGRALGPGAEYLEVFRLAGATAFAGYALGLFQASIWGRRSWSTTFKSVLDGLVYALVTAGVFGWLWP